MSPALPKTYKAAVAEKANSPLVIKEVPLTPPAGRQVLVKVMACGVCYSDCNLIRGRMGPQFPRIPGHEIVGEVAAVGPDVTRFTVGARVGGAWHGGHDGTCRACARSQFQMCDNKVINGFNVDGGYGEYVLLREEAVVRVPETADPAAVAPLLCAGVTVFNGMRKLRVEQGNLVAVQGVGGLGHLAIQFASKMGYRVVAISSGESKRDFAARLGAHAYINSSSEDVVERLNSMGGAAMICATAPSPKAISPLVGGLQPGGKLLMLTVVGEVPFNSGFMVRKGLSVHGWPSGHALDGEEAIQFAGDHGIECMTEMFSLQDVQKAIDKVEDGSMRFKGVLRF